MTLKDDLQNDIDFKLVSHLVWSKLLHSFGGAPELSYFLVSKDEVGSFGEPDFNPIKI